MRRRNRSLLSSSNCWSSFTNVHVKDDYSIKTVFGQGVRRSLLSPLVLRTRRQFYTKAVTFLYACNKHKIIIEPDMAIYRAVPRIPSQSISTRNISMIRRLELELGLPEEGQSSQISMGNITLAEEHLRGICLSLSSRGTVLERLMIGMLNGFTLDLRAGFELLDPLKELRVDSSSPCVGDRGVPVERYPNKLCSGRVDGAHSLTTLLFCSPRALLTTLRLTVIIV